MTERPIDFVRVNINEDFILAFLIYLESDNIKDHNSKELLTLLELCNIVRCNACDEYIMQEDSDVNKYGDTLCEECEE